VAGRRVARPFALAADARGRVSARLGKTRVAVEVALRAASGFHDGTTFVALAAASDPTRCCRP
jgi:hypothetical protein